MTSVQLESLRHDALLLLSASGCESGQVSDQRVDHLNRFVQFNLWMARKELCCHVRCLSPPSAGGADSVVARFQKRSGYTGSAHSKQESSPSEHVVWSGWLLPLTATSSYVKLDRDCDWAVDSAASFQQAMSAFDMPADVGAVRFAMQSLCNPFIDSAAYKVEDSAKSSAVRSLATLQTRLAALNQAPEDDASSITAERARLVAEYRADKLARATPVPAVKRIVSDPMSIIAQAPAPQVNHDAPLPKSTIPIQAAPPQAPTSTDKVCQRCSAMPWC